MAKAGKATVQERQEMQRTQPKKVRLIKAEKGGKGRMITVEESEVVKERRAAKEAK